MADPVQGTDPTGAIMTEYYYASERAAVGEENLSKGRFHHRGTGSLRYRGLAEYYRTIRAGRARDLARQAAINAARSAMGRLRGFELRNDIARAGADAAGAAVAANTAQDVDTWNTVGAWASGAAGVAGVAAGGCYLAAGGSAGTTALVGIGLSVLSAVLSGVSMYATYQVNELDSGAMSDDQYNASMALGTTSILLTAVGLGAPGATARGVAQAVGHGVGVSSSAMGWATAQ